RTKTRRGMGGTEARQDGRRGAQNRSAGRPSVGRLGPEGPGCGQAPSPPARARDQEALGACAGHPFPLERGAPGAVQAGERAARCEPFARRLGLMRIVVDLNRCEGYAQCCFLAPEVFRLAGEEALRYDPTPDDALREKI